jgi:hypothetical protein
VYNNVFSVFESLSIIHLRSKVHVLSETENIASFFIERSISVFTEFRIELGPQDCSKYYDQGRQKLTNTILYIIYISTDTVNLLR